MFIPKVQELVSNKAANFIENKIGTKVDIGGIYLDFPNGISIEEVYLEDQQADTLFYAGELDVAIDYFALFHGEVEASDISIKDVVAHIAVDADTSFNFDYIIEAFAVDSTPQAATTDTTASALSFDIGNVSLENIYFTYQSEPDGLSTKFNLGQLSFYVEEFDLEEEVYLADELSLQNSTGSVVFIKNVPPSEEVSEVSKMIIGARSTTIKNVDFRFENIPDELKLITEIGQLQIDAEPIDLAKQKVELSMINLDSSLVDFSMKSVVDSTTENQTSTESAIWKVSLEELSVNQLAFNYNDKAAPKYPKQVDFGHLGLQIDTLQSNDIYFNGIEDLGGNINQLVAQEKSGFAIGQAEVDFKMDSNQINLQALEIRTNNSYINAPTRLQFNSLEGIADNIGALQFNTRFNNSKLSLKDMYYFNPEVLDSLPLPDLTKRNFYLNGKVYGKVEDINFQQLSIQTAKNTQLKLDGNVKGIPDIEQLSFNLGTLNLTSTAKDLRTLLGNELIPPSIQLPANLNLKADAKGRIDDMAANLQLNTSLGNLSSKANLKNITDSINAAYNLSVEIPSFDLGTLLQDSLLGELGFEGTVDGKGLTLESMVIDMNASVKDFEYQNYEYADLKINGKFEKEMFDGNILMNDSNLIFDFSGVAKLDSTLPRFDFLLNLKAADLQHLGFSDEDLRVRGKFDIDIEGSTLENLNGGLDIRDVLIIKNGEQYAIDSLLFLSIIDTNYTDISIASTLLDASFKGKINLAELPATFENHFKQYLGSKDFQATSKQQDFVFNIELHDPALLTDVLLPDLSHFKTGDINGSFDSKTDVFDMNIYFSSIHYADIVIDSLYFVTESNPEKMTADLMVKRVGYDTLAMENISFSNVLQNDSLTSYFKISDDTSAAQFQLAGGLTNKNNTYRFSFFPNEQIIDYETWSVKPENEIIFKDQLVVNQLKFSNKTQSISLQTEGDYLNTYFNNFELSNIFDLIQRNNQQATDFSLMLQEASEKAKEQNDSLERDTMAPLISGQLNADLKLPLTPNALLSGTADIDNIEVHGIPIGNLNLEAKSTADFLKLTTSLKGKGNRFFVEGKIGTESYDFDLNIERLKLKTIEAFSNGQLQNSQGYLSGKANLSTSGKETDMSGVLNFNDILFKSAYLGEEYHFKNEKVTFKNEKLYFEKFTVLDSADQPFKINGDIALSDFNNPKFNLNITAKNFQFLNTSKSGENDLFYGKVFITADIDIKGDAEKPIVRSSVGLNKGTDITFVVPATEVASVNHEGIVKFVDKDSKLPELLREDKTVDTIRTDFEGVDLEAFIDINEFTKVTIVIDPITGDRLLVRGGGKIKTNVDVAGNISMNGIYEIKDGNYELRLYNLVRRRFDLVPGSKIIWNGDPLRAEMDIEGMYTAKAAPIDLLGNQISSLTEVERQQYKRKLPFEVILMIGGEIMEPIISFKLDLPEDDKGALGGVVLAKLQEINQDESELNKQVFSLIVLKRFFSQDPFSSGGAGSNAARQSVSQLLNQQLNSLTDKYVKGVEIELNVDSYEDYGDNGELQGRTDLNVALSKQFFDDRLKVRLNGDFGVENQQANSSGVAGDISVEYKVTEDGRYRLKFYRDNKFAGFIEGQLIETGVSLIYTREYQKFKNLFKKPENIEIEENDE